MPLILEGRVPTRWAESRDSRRAASVEEHAKRSDAVSLALINNMPDAALEDTELQFFELLDIASGNAPVYLRLYSLTGVPRTDRGQRHLNNFYFDFDDLWRNRFDGVLITGTEPHHANLRDEPYWQLMADVFDWAERSTDSTILSCLAAHASVLHSDGINRHRLPDKQFGVFASQAACEHPLMRNAGSALHFPHSRWNEVREEELTSADYKILTSSDGAGVDLFVKKKKQSLFVHFQGHPEYGTQTLLKEYRRDIKRFLNRERETYPSLPAGYFDTAATKFLSEYQRQALDERKPDFISSFPETLVTRTLQNTWHTLATSVYRNWLQHLIEKKSETASFVAMASNYGRSQQKHGVLSS
jgi:homoserine O-succinyltransferase